MATRTRTRKKAEKAKGGAMPSDEDCVKVLMEMLVEYANTAEVAAARVTSSRAGAMLERYENMVAERDALQAEVDGAETDLVEKSGKAIDEDGLEEAEETALISRLDRKKYLRLSTLNERLAVEEQNRVRDTDKSNEAKMRRRVLRKVIRVVSKSFTVNEERRAARRAREAAEEKGE